MTGRAVPPPDLLTEWARLLLGSLREAGVRDVVISPGSRSTPFVWAALHTTGLRCRTAIDERSAAFFALGHARMTDRPVLLICTSGSAAANYFPAIVEAAEAAVPMLVITADRPLELQRAAAPQTIDQVKLYGDHVRSYLELGTPDADPRMLDAIPRLAAQAVLAARAPLPGPVHINARARKPLEPVPGGGAGAANGDLHARVDRLLAGVPAAEPSIAAPTRAAVERLVDACRPGRRGLIVCGPALPSRHAGARLVGELARRTGFPVVAEAASQLRFGPLPGATRLGALAALLEVPGFAADHRPDLVLQIGRPPTASAWNTAFAEWQGVERHVVSPHGWSDPWSAATSLVQAPLDTTLEALVAGLSESADGTAGTAANWPERLLRAERRAWEVISAVVREGFPEGAAVRTVVDRLPEDAVLSVGNSLPIREVDLFVPPGDRRLVVSAQRGANGIDGLISGAAGAAAASGRPTTLLIGDVSFAHDIGGLARLRDLDAPLTVVVLNNGGGRIFERLPLAELLRTPATIEAWRTPPRLDMAAAAAAYGLPFGRATDAGSLERALDRAGAGGRSGVVEVVVPEEGTIEHQRALRDRLASALEG